MIEQLRQPVSGLAGIGPSIAGRLARLGLRTVGQVLFFFPRDYQDLSHVCRIGQLDDAVASHRAVSVCGRVDEVELRTNTGGRSVLGALITDDSGALRAVWFNQPYMQNRLKRGTRVMLSGQPRLHGLRWEMTHPHIYPLDETEQPEAGEILPIYALTEGVNQNQIRKIVRAVVQSLADVVPEVFPGEFRRQTNLWPVAQALREIHLPASRENLDSARRRFIYQELLTLQLALAMRRWSVRHQSQAPPLERTAKIDARIRRLFAFELTADQQNAIDEIAADMSQSVPMNRLLEGEVGSGKTVVAEYAILLAVAYGYQAALMAPTEVLANQHLRVLSEDLQQSRVRIGLLSGALSGTPRTQLLDAVRAGELDVVVGTQALLNEATSFQRLGLVVIDEQHKFGVRQRAALKQAGLQPHYLVMTATPIPRTVTMALFGDLDLSVLRQSPPGRQAVHTYLGSEQQREKWWNFYRRKLGEGRQGYVIAPLIEGDSSPQGRGVEQLYRQLSAGPLRGFRIGMIHGRMTTSEKETAMEDFRRKRTRVLVATTVIEVGINVPNATLMTIEGGERFGLAQLHQLRGRIRRGVFPGYLCVFAQPATEDAQQRLDAFTRITDGFELAEVDLQLRGPGDLFGTVQHGMPPLRVADLRTDRTVLEEARQTAQELLDGDTPMLFRVEFDLLRQRVLQRYGKVLDLADVG